MRVYGRGAGFGGRQTTSAVKVLLIANVAVFVLQMLTRGAARYGFVDDWCSFVPQLAIFGGQVWRFATYMFLHGDFWHIGMNMFMLWMFGSQLEALWGRRMFLTYYFVCGVGAALIYGVFKLFGYDSMIPMMGASGAVFGLLLAYGLTFSENIILVFFILPMKAKYAVLIFGMIELFSIPSGGSVAHLAHLGGMAVGFLFLRFTAPGLARGGGLDGIGRAWRNFRTRSRMRVVPPNKRANGKTGANGGNGQNDAPPSPEQKRIDTILDKISREGLQSLTDEEQEILRRAGRR
ncbi:MAG: rhomboid family intramembrane serine protease [bacterium]|nr:rhomboid family intramembrane serine protease [bacterium]